MAQNTTSSSISYPVTRRTVHTSLPFNTVMSNLYTSIGSPTSLKWPSIASNITSYDETSKKKFIQEVEAAVGPEGFMNFAELNHGAWLPLFDIDSSPHLQLKRIILGNPLIAITMLSKSARSLDAGLYVPVEILVRELSSEGRGGTEIKWQVPSTMIGAVDEGNEELQEAARALDSKLEQLVEVIVGGS